MATDILIMRPYNKRTWLNKIKSSSTSNIVAFDGEVDYGEKKYRDTFIKISDCKNSIRLHKRDSETMKEFTNKLRLLISEMELFINHLEQNNENK
jgi:hypothetical protein